MNIWSMHTLSPAGNDRRRNGFTLIELMMVVAVIAIITTIAYPSYTGHVRKAKRATAQAALVDIGAYTITLAVDNVASPMTFVATATPINGQNTGGEQTLTLNQAGARTPNGKTGYWGQ